MTNRQTPMSELNRRAFKLLLKEWGPADTLRFFSQMGLGMGNYTEERRTLFADLTLDDYRRGLQELKAAKSSDTKSSPL